MAADKSSSSGTNSTADSYIGSLISLTSKSEIRYEGVLCNINTEESTIGLQNVRSFGTEGRKKDGPQIPPSDRVYEYILFRGSDIKDLQVKSSLPAQATPPVINDPAIIQSQYAPQTSSSNSFSTAVTALSTDVASYSAPMGLPGTNFPGGLPLYHPGGSIGSWGASPPHSNANASGLAMPMYWQGYYPPPTGLEHLHQHSLLKLPPGMPVASMPQPVQFPQISAPLPIGPSNLPQASTPFLTRSSNSLTESSSLALSSLSSNLPPAPSSTVTTETLPNPLLNKAPMPALSTTPTGSNLPLLLSLTTTSENITAAPPISNKLIAMAGPNLSSQNACQSTSSVMDTSVARQAESPPSTLAPALVTPGQLMQSGSMCLPSTQSSQAAHKDVEIVQISEPSASIPRSQPPLLPLPQHPQGGYQPKGAPFQSRHGYRGRERGRGIMRSQPITKFTEDFDFVAMNEKFNKDEVWGHLGQGSRAHSRNKEDDTHAGDEDAAGSSNFEMKSVYNKDDFFDSLSCDALGHGSRGGRTKFSEQRKIDTETFGNFSRRPGGYGMGHSGGHTHVPYYGRGYGYAGRARGRAVYSRAS